MALIHVAKTSEITPGTMKTYTVQGKTIAIANLDGEFFAVDDTCTHEKCSLGSEGILDGNVVICGCHGASFDVTNGNVLSLPAPTDLVSYEVKITGENIFIDLKN